MENNEKEQLKKLFIQACEEGDFNKVKELISAGVNPNVDGNSALTWASIHDDVDMVKLLLSDRRVNPAVYYTNPLEEACTYGNIEVVKLLLSDGRIDPSDNNNEAIKTAVYHGYLDIVKLLLNDERVDPLDDNDGYIDDAYILAKKKGYTDMLDAINEWHNKKYNYYLFNKDVGSKKNLNEKKSNSVKMQETLKEVFLLEKNISLKNAINIAKYLNRKK